MNELMELAERCERLMGWDRETDALIDATLRVGKADHPEWVRKNFPVWRARPDGRVEVVGSDGTGGVHWESARFTSSIDAAMTLVPEGWRWQVSDRAPVPHKGRAYLHNDQLHFANHMQPNPKYKHAEVTAATPALALCCAALRAKASMVHLTTEQSSTPIGHR